MTRSDKAGRGAENALREHNRLAQVVALFGKHGLRAVAARFGFTEGQKAPLGSARPEAVVGLLRDIGPVAIKFGQILAMRSDLLDPEWIEALTTLQDRVPALPFEIVRPMIEEAIGGSIESCFARFDEEALAAASIAQVHAATLLDGREVIVKVRRPGIERIVDVDLRLLRRLARMAERSVPEIRRLKPDEMLRHFAENLDHEMDLSAEARNSEAIGAFLAGLGVRTAKFEWELTGRRVNVQERLYGSPASALDHARERGIDLQGMANTYSQAVLRMIIMNGQFHADPHPGNVFFLANNRLGFIDFGSVGTLLPKRRDELVRLGLAIATEDVAGVADVLMLWAGDPEVDRDRLELALAALIDRFRDIVLGQIDLSEVFQRVFALLREFQLALPPDLALVLRTLLTAEGFVRRIDPSYDIASQLAPLAKELLRERISPARLRAEGGKLFGALGRATLSAPAMISQLEKLARTGTIPVSIAGSDLDKLMRGSRPRNGSDYQVYPAALAICAAVTYSTEPTLSLVLALISAGSLAVGRLWSR
ncbi:AarF/UbiB family protein [Sphingomonas sp. MJ1 (PH-R8)]|uniref:ABC1 kinase family protein n=1 Tax=Sphingomonas sp. MJ1 (PH-R8) TaxID=3112950 RepID=UPI003A880303